MVYEIQNIQIWLISELVSSILKQNNKCKFKVLKFKYMVLRSLKRRKVATVSMEIQKIQFV